MEFNNRFNGYEVQNNESSPDIGSKIALWGALLTAIGDSLALVGGAIAIEESKIADQQQQQTLDNLQSQIDDLKEAQSQNDVMGIDIDNFNKLVEQMVEMLDTSENSKGNNKRS